MTMSVLWNSYWTPQRWCFECYNPWPGCTVVKKLGDGRALATKGTDYQECACPGNVSYIPCPACGRGCDPEWTHCHPVEGCGHGTAGVHLNGQDDRQVKLQPVSCDKRDCACGTYQPDHRIQTASGRWLELLVRDHVGLVRRPGEPDDAFRARVMTAIKQQTRVLIDQARRELHSRQVLDTSRFVGTSIADAGLVEVERDPVSKGWNPYDREPEDVAACRTRLLGTGPTLLLPR